LGAIIPATGDKFIKAETLGVNLQDVLDKKVTLSVEQVALFKKEQLPTDYTSFGGFEIHNLYEFFMVFVILCGIAAIILAFLTPKLKKMMHGIR
ncbi:MAG TPA: MFS transporter, partial [Flavobacterium alvei]|nr:MFS transporter [Flavobacterium alvei]